LNLKVQKITFDQFKDMYSVGQLFSNYCHGSILRRCVNFTHDMSLIWPMVLFAWPQ